MSWTGNNLLTSACYTSLPPYTHDHIEGRASCHTEDKKWLVCLEVSIPLILCVEVTPGSSRVSQDLHNILFKLGSLRMSSIILGPCSPVG